MGASSSSSYPSSCLWRCRKVAREGPFQLPKVFCISPTARKWIRIVIQFSLLAFVLLIVIIWLGSEWEYYHMRRASDTLEFYELDDVCAVVATADGGGAVRTETFASAAVARNASQTITVAHCGQCGACSTPHDIQIYDETKNSLLGKTYTCAKRGFLWGRKTASNCMKQEVGLSGDCHKCWVDNIMCDLRLCLFTCTWQGMFNEVDTGKEGQTLNRCTLCDELRCGPQFVRCAGANRRRSGILSDIDRDLDTEVCTEVETDWWNDPIIQEQWYEKHH